jgi:hypothetical protein
VQDATRSPGRVDGGKDTDIVAATEKLIGQRLNVPVHAALVGPGIWRNETDAHGT